MSATELDISYQYRGLRNRSSTLKAIEAQAAAKGLHYSGLAEDVFNLLYQRNPTLRDNLDPNSAYTDIIRAVANSESLTEIRKKTRGDIYWSGLGAGVLISEIASKINLENEPEPENNPPPPGGEECEDGDPGNKPNENESERQKPNEDSDEESETNQSDSESDKESDEQSENGSSQSDEDSDEESSEDSEGESEESDSDSDSDENESGEGESSEGEESNEDGTDEGWGNPRSNRGSDSHDDSDSNGDDSDDSEESDSDDEELDDEFEDEDSGEESDEESEEGDSESEESSDPRDSGEWESKDTRDIPQGPIEEAQAKQVDPNSGEIDQAIQNAIDEAASKLGEQMGGLQAGKGDSQLTEKDRLQVMDAFAKIATNKTLSDIILTIGRLKLDNRFMSAMSSGEPEEVIGITMGRDLKDALPNEIGKALGDDAELFDFATRWDAGKLLIRENRNNEHVGKGPIVACVDRSGSMNPTRTRWASMLTVALYLQSVKEHRPFALVLFGSRAVAFEPNSNRILDPRFLETCQAEYNGGGTDFELAWRKAIEFMTKHRNKSTWKNADIVFVTDGEDYIDKDSWLREKAKLNLRLFTFVIGASEEQAYTVRILPTYNAETGRYENTGQAVPLHQNFWDMRDTADGMMFITNLDAADEKTAFSMIRSKAQKRNVATGKR